MDLHCENCGQPALASDATCWQCGEPLPGREESSQENVSVKEGWQSSVSLTSLGFYIGSTIAVTIIFFLAARALGQSPLVQVGLGDRPPSKWEMIINADQSITLWLPEDWDWLDKLDDTLATDFAANSEGKDLFYMAILPLASQVNDMELIFIASGSGALQETAFPILAVGRSVTLNQISNKDFVGIKEENLIIHNVSVVDNFNKSYISLDIEMINKEKGLDSMQCQQQFIRGQMDSFIVSLCAPAGEFTSYQSVFDTIFGSVQKLTS